jgi:2-desacetyl-2-hydroxyethyl bacteriochlorophyllide A dehydrogenase
VPDERVAVITAAAGTFRLEPAAAPSPGPGEVVVAALATGICGSDLHLFSGDHPYASYPLVQGHEVVGHVDEIGAGVDAGLLGRLIVVEPTMECGSCPECARGAYNRCENLQVIGVQRAGSLGGRFITRASKLHGVPDTADESAWALVEPVAVACHAVARSAVVEGDVVVVLGAGVIGLALALALGERHLRELIVVEPSEQRRRRVDELGLGRAVSPEELAGELARAQPAGADVIFEATGSAAVLGGAHELARPGGQIVVVGQSGASFSLPMIVMTRKELSLIGTRNSANQFPVAIALLAANPAFSASVITHRFPAREAQAAFGELLTPGTPALKILLAS